MRKASVLFVAAALAAFGLTACGSSSDNSNDTTAASTTATTTTGGGGGGGTILAISTPADGSLAFNQTSLDAKAGQVTIDFNNPASLSHDVKVQDSSGNEVGGTDLVAQGSATASLNLKPGTYTFFCSVPGHEAAGMKGTITVK